MKKKLKRTVALLTVLAMSVLLLAGCGGSSGGEEAPSGNTNGITVFNSKMEIQDVFESDLASAYEAETGVPVEVYFQAIQ